MITFKQTNLENCSYFFFNDTINIKNTDPNLLSIDNI